MKPAKSKESGCDMPAAAMSSVPSHEFDLTELRETLEAYRPLLDELKADMKGSDASTGSFPADADRERVAAAVAKQREPLRKLLSPLKGAPVTDKELDTLLREGMERAFAATGNTASQVAGLEPLLRHNLVADGVYRRTSSHFVYLSPGTAGVVFNLGDPDDRSMAEIILVVSVTVEVLGLIAALAGIMLPNVPLTRIANRLRRSLTSPSVRKKLRALLRLLRDTGKSMAEKLEGILRFLNYLAGAGLVSDLVAQILAEWSWWRIGLVIAQLLAQIALWLIPGAQGPLIASRGVAIANAVMVLTNKARDMGDMLKD